MLNPNFFGFFSTDFTWNMLEGFDRWSAILRMMHEYEKPNRKTGEKDKTIISVIGTHRKCCKITKIQHTSWTSCTST